MAEEKTFKLPEPIPFEINGTQYLFHFNNYALVVLSDLVKSDPINCHHALMEITKRDILEGITYIVYAGIVGYQKSQGNFAHGIQFKSVCEYMANADINQFDTAWEAYKQCSGMSEFLANQKSDKKKVHSHG